MPKEKQRFFFDNKREVVKGKFHELKSDNNQQAPRYNLCTFNDLNYKQTARGPRERTETEKANFLNRLYLQKLEELTEKKNNTETLKNQSPLMQEVMQEWLDELESLERAPRTIDAYLVTNNYYLQIVGNHPIHEYKPTHVNKLINHLKSAGVKGNTLQKHVRHLKAFFNYAYENGYLDKPVRIKKVKTVEREPHVYA